MNKPSNILLLYNHPFWASAPTIMEHVNSFGAHSLNNFWAVNTGLGFPFGLSKLKFDVIVLHYSLFGAAPFSLSRRFQQYVAGASDALKIAFFQDEHQFCRERFQTVNELGVEIVYSLLDAQYFQEVYLKNTSAKVVLPTLTGYVSPTLTQKAEVFSRPLQDRGIEIGYRARPLPFYMGRGAQEKTEIADGVLSRLEGTSLKIDIKTGEEDRIYGDDWYRFVANCRFMIGVEAGVSVFDLDGTAQVAVDEFLQRNPGASFNEVYNHVLRDIDGKIFYRTISPRIFEAAAMRVGLILFEGKYNSILKPDLHYIPLKKDFSNFDSVLERMRDQKYVDAMLEAAHRDLIASGAYSYEHFIAQFDEDLLIHSRGRVPTNCDPEMISRKLASDEWLRKPFNEAKGAILRNNQARGLLRKAYRFVKALGQ